MTRAQFYTTVSRMPGRRQLVSRTQSFAVGVMLGALVAWTLVGAPL